MLPVVNAVPVKLMAVLTELLPDIKPVFASSSPSVGQLQIVMRQRHPLGVEIGSSLDYGPVLWIQLLTLVTLFQCGGGLMQAVSDIVRRDQTLSVSYQDGSTFTFRLGVWDDAFFKYLMHQFAYLFIAQVPPATLCDMLGSYQLVLTEYQRKMTHTEDRMMTLIDSLSDGVDDTVLQNINDVFSLIAVLPASELSVFFMTLQQYLPDDLEAQLMNGQTIDVCYLFEQPSTDNQFLSQKLQVLFGLCQSGDSLIVQKVLHTSGRSILKRLIQPTQVRNQVCQSIDNVVQQVVQPQRLACDTFVRFINYLQ